MCPFIFTFNPYLLILSVVLSEKWNVVYNIYYTVNSLFNCSISVHYCVVILCHGDKILLISLYKTTSIMAKIKKDQLLWCLCNKTTRRYQKMCKWQVHNEQKEAPCHLMYICLWNSLIWDTANVEGLSGIKKWLNKLMKDNIWQGLSNMKILSLA